MEPIDILAACCSKGSARYAIRNPFRVGGLVYATDGRILARADIEGEFECEHPPPIQLLSFSREQYDAEPAEMPEMAPVAPACKQCRGVGMYECVCGDCGHRHGVPCSCIDGKDWSLGLPHDLGGVQLAPRYVAKLMAFGASAYPTTDPDKRASSPVYWETSNGVSGIVMPCLVTPNHSGKKGTP